MSSAMRGSAAFSQALLLGVSRETGSSSTCATSGPASTCFLRDAVAAMQATWCPEDCVGLWTRHSVDTIAARNARISRVSQESSSLRDQGVNGSFPSTERSHRFCAQGATTSDSLKNVVSLLPAILHPLVFRHRTVRTAILLEQHQSGATVEMGTKSHCATAPFCFSLDSTPPNCPFCNERESLGHIEGSWTNRVRLHTIWCG
jgi:hypothetical protein